MDLITEMKAGQNVLIDQILDGNVHLKSFHNVELENYGFAYEDYKNLKSRIEKFLEEEKEFNLNDGAIILETRFAKNLLNKMNFFIFKKMSKEGECYGKIPQALKDMLKNHDYGWKILERIALGDRDKRMSKKKFEICREYYLTKNKKALLRELFPSGHAYSQDFGEVPVRIKFPQIDDSTIKDEVKKMILKIERTHREPIIIAHADAIGLEVNEATFKASWGDPMIAMEVGTHMILYPKTRWGSSEKEHQMIHHLHRLINTHGTQLFLG